jgi:hypothetical protein
MCNNNTALVVLFFQHSSFFNNVKVTEYPFLKPCYSLLKTLNSWGENLFFWKWCFQMICWENLVRVLVHNSTRRHHRKSVFGAFGKYFTLIEFLKNSALHLRASHSSCFNISFCRANTRYLAWFEVMVNQSMLRVILTVKLGRNPVLKWKLLVISVNKCTCLDLLPFIPLRFRGGILRAWVLRPVRKIAKSDY